jgi:hypothetical protein
MQEMPNLIGLTSLEALEVIGGEEDEPSTLLKALPASFGQLGALKKLTLCDLNELPDLIGLTALQRYPAGGGRADPRDASAGYPRQDDRARADTGPLQETENTTGVNHASVAAAKAVDFGGPAGGHAVHRGPHGAA